ncbi:MAG: hypothetical protein O2799_10510, partial [Planctomycetota bacterium]|nr:hypothetical protein [Planctomycetota bacterium]
RGATSPSEDLDARGWERLPAGPPLEGLEEEDLTGWRGGLVLEAETGKPLAGARLRVFREDWYDPLEPLLPLVTTFTGRDGAFTLFAGDPRFEGAEKLLLDAPGRRSLEVPLGEAWGELFLLEPETALEVEVRDLEGRPIAGAVLKTTTTCSHAPPAWHALTSRFGLASLAAAPSVHDAGDLDLEADGHQAVADRSVHDGWAWSARTGTFTLFLAPQARMQVCALRADGTPVPEGWRLVRQSDGPWRVARVGSGGRASFRSPGGPPGSASLWIAPPRAFEPREWIPSPARHAGELLTTRAGLDALWPELPEVCLLTVLGAPSDLRVVASGPQGLVEPPREGEAWVLPPGPALVLSGGAFSGYEPSRLELDLEGDAEVTLAAVPERAVDLGLLAAVDWSRAVLAVEESSRELRAEDLAGATIPGGEDAVLFVELADGAAWTFPLPAGQGPLTPDPALGQPLRPALPEPERWVTLTLTHAHGWPAEDAWAAVYAGGDWLEETPLPKAAPSQGPRFLVPAGERVHIEVDGDGLVPWRTSLVPEEDAVVMAPLQRMATLHAELEDHALQIGGHTLSPDEARQGVDLPPGTYEARAIHPNGARWSRTVKLEAGDQRTLR